MRREGGPNFPHLLVERRASPPVGPRYEALKAVLVNSVSLW
jgi:hypothetical protein